MVKRSQPDHDDVTPDSPVQPAEAAVSKPAESDWREVALFVCERCGKEKRSQAHRNMVCRDCAAS